MARRSGKSSNRRGNLGAASMDTSEVEGRLRHVMDTGAGPGPARKAAAVAVSLYKGTVPVDTGNLRASAQVRPDPRGATVLVAADYAAHVEYGTDRMDARPRLRPALDASRKVLEDEARKQVAQAVRSSRGRRR